MDIKTAMALTLYLKKDIEDINESGKLDRVLALEIDTENEYNFITIRETTRDYFTTRVKTFETVDSARDFLKGIKFILEI